MTLDEVIKYTEEVANAYEDLYETPAIQFYDYNKSAKEHHQLAEWLKDYKRLLEQDTISRQAVLNKIKEVCFSEEWLQFRVDNGSNGQRDFLINYIEQLAPVASQPKMEIEE